MRNSVALAGWLLFPLAVLLAPARTASLPAQEEKPPAEQTAQEKPPEPLVIPEAEKNRKNPVAPDRESIQRGRNLFSSQCVWCHGPKGDGKGELAVADNLPTPDFTAAQQKKRTDGELFYILVHGHGGMPGQGSRLREKQKWDLINFIRSLAPAAKPKALKPN